MSAWLNRLTRWVEELTGVTSVHETHGEGFMAGYVKRRAGELGLSPLALVMHLEEEAPHSEEWRRFISGLTNGQTSFFRDREQFDVMAEVLSRAAKKRGGKPLRIWSSACSTGEEAYSLAILCKLHGMDANILATDINDKFLEIARAGVYDEWSLRNVGSLSRLRYFEPCGGGHRVGDEVREQVRFGHHNLARDPLPSSGVGDGRWDLIVCRNVLMYFRRERMATICRRIAKGLGPSGSLVLAACESLYGLEVPLTPHLVGARIVYRHGSPLSTRPYPAPFIPAATPGAVEEKVERVEVGRGGATVVPAPGLLEADGGLPAERKIEPTVGGLLDLGHGFMKEHRFHEAGQAYERAEQIDSLLSEVHLFKGLLFRKQGRWDEAGQAFRQALFLTPSLWQAAYLLAGVHERLGRRREALRERISTLRILDEHGDAVTFLSNPAFVNRFCPSEEEVRRALRI